MKLLINTASTYKGGGVQNAKSFIEECRKFESNEYHVILGKSLHNKIEEGNFPDNFKFHEINHRPATKVFSLSDQSKFHKKIEHEVKPDVVFTTSGPAYWRSKVPHLVGYNLPHYIYPDSPFFNVISIYKKAKWKFRGKVIRHFFKKDADAYVVQTDDVNNRLKDWLKTEKPIYTVSNTCNSYYFNPKIYPNKLPENKGCEFRLLLLSAYYHHKNFEIIPQIISKFNAEDEKRIRFVLTLEEEYYNKVIPHEQRKYVYNVGPVKIEEGPSLYKECDGMFLPTLLECFSASYPEAMAMEKPIVTTDLGFARSICGNAALFYEPVNAEDAAKKIKQLINDKKLQKDLIHKGKMQLKKFDTPRSRADKYLNICKKISANFRESSANIREKN